jgi:hypothetical protein
MAAHSQEEEAEALEQPTTQTVAAQYSQSRAATSPSGT